MRVNLLLLGSCAASFCLGCLISVGLLTSWGPCPNYKASNSSPLTEDEFEPPAGPLRPVQASAAKRRTLLQRPIKDPLWSRVRIFCWVLTSPKNHATKAYHQMATWLRRCNGFAFMTTRPDPFLPTVVLGVSEGRDNLWQKTRASLLYIRHSDHHLTNYDYFFKADDDTYAVMDNLRSLLAAADPETPLYVGRRFRPFVRQGYMSGGAGYVLSRAAVRRLADFGQTSREAACLHGHFKSEDVNLGVCLEMLGVRVLDSPDSLGRERFHPFRPEHHLAPGGLPSDNWLHRYNYYPLRVGPECCSDTSITFHYVTPRQMYVLDFLIYKLRRPTSLATASPLATETNSTAH